MDAKIIREVAEYDSLPVLDLFAMGGIQPDIKEIQETYVPDGRHPNVQGTGATRRQTLLLKMKFMKTRFFQNHNQKRKDNLLQKDCLFLLNVI